MNHYREKGLLCSLCITCHLVYLFGEWLPKLLTHLWLTWSSYLSKMIDCLFHNVSSYDPVALDCRYPIMGQSNLAPGNDLTIIFCLTFLPNFLPCILFTIKSRSTTFIFLFSCFRDYQSIMFTVSFWFTGRCMLVLETLSIVSSMPGLFIYMLW